MLAGARGIKSDGTTNIWVGCGGGGSSYIGKGSGNYYGGYSSFKSPTSSGNETGHSGNGYAKITPIN